MRDRKQRRCNLSRSALDEKALYVAIIETVSVIILRIERDNINNLRV